MGLMDTEYDQQEFVMDGYPDLVSIPVVDRTQAVVMMATHADRDPGVFWDRGWGDHSDGPMISIILSGDGQNPIGFITTGTYNLLREGGTIGPNTLHTMKERKFHAFAGEGEPNPPAALAGCACLVCAGVAS